MPTNFWGLFLLSTGLSLVATFTAVGVTAFLRRMRTFKDEEQPRIR
jgi:hypothetical protein